jgi:hypothetical protein
VSQSHLRPIDRAAGRLVLVVMGVAAAVAAGMIVYGVVRSAPSEIIAGVAVILSAGVVAFAVLDAFRRNTRFPLSKLTGHVERVTANVRVQPQANPPSSLSGIQDGSGSATLRIRRLLGGRADRLRRYQLWIDGGLAGELAPDQMLQVQLPPGHHTIHLQIDWCRSRRVPCVIPSGETLALVCAPGANALTAILMTTVLCKRYIRIRPDIATG